MKLREGSLTSQTTVVQVRCVVTTASLVMGPQGAAAAQQQARSYTEMGRGGEMVMGIVVTRYSVDKNICC